MHGERHGGGAIHFEGERAHAFLALYGGLHEVIAIHVDGDHGAEFLAGSEVARRCGGGRGGLRREQFGGGECLLQVGRDDGAVENLLGCLDVAFDEEGRDEEGFAVGIEAGAAGAVVGEQLGDVVIDAQQIADGVVILAAVEAAQGDRSGEVTDGAGGLAEAVIDPGGDAQAFLFGELGFDRRHGAIAQLGGDVAPESAIGLDVLGGIGFEEIDAIPGIGGVVAGGAVLRQDRTDGFGELVACGSAGGQREAYAAGKQEHTWGPKGQAHLRGRGPPPHRCDDYIRSGSAGRAERRRRAGAKAQMRVAAMIAPIR